jgi:hypothetical protein
MAKLTPDQIRKRFEASKGFNELFDAFSQALEQHLSDIELYRPLFWNHALTPDELRLFGEKLAQEFPAIAYDIYLWLASVFEATYSTRDNYELALTYFRKAAASKPGEPAPYLEAANCYEPDLKIPSIGHLIDFLKQGAAAVAAPQEIYKRLTHLYELAGNDEMSMFYRRKSEEGSPPLNA